MIDLKRHYFWAAVITLNVILICLSFKDHGRFYLYKYNTVLDRKTGIVSEVTPVNKREYIIKKEYVAVPPPPPGFELENNKK